MHWFTISICSCICWSSKISHSGWFLLRFHWFQNSGDASRILISIFGFLLWMPISISMLVSTFSKNSTGLLNFGIKYLFGRFSFSFSRYLTPSLVFRPPRNKKCASRVSTISIILYTSFCLCLCLYCPKHYKCFWNSESTLFVVLSWIKCSCVFSGFPKGSSLLIQRKSGRYSKQSAQ